MADCLLDTLPARTDGTLCWRHHDVIAAMLDPDNHGDPAADRPASIPVMHAMLDPTPGGGATGRRKPGHGSVPAASPHIVSMLDDRSRVGTPQVWFGAGPNGKPDETRPYLEDEAAPRAVRKALRGLADSLVERWEIAGPLLPDGGHHHNRAVTQLAGWLHTHVHDITALPDADWIHDDLLELSDQLRPAIGDAYLPPTGRCIELIRDKASRDVRECRCPLYLPAPTRDPDNQTPEQAQRAVVTTCRRCHRAYTWLDLIRLRMAG